MYRILFFTALISILCLAQNHATAQAFKKGDLIIGVSGSTKARDLHSSNSWCGNTAITRITLQTDFAFNSSIEYATSKRLGIGLNVGQTNYLKTIFQNEFYSTDRLKSFFGNLRANYHLGRSKIFDPYFGLGFGFGHVSRVMSYNYSFQVSPTTIESPSFNLEIVSGIRIYPAKRHAISAEYGYAMTTYNIGYQYKIRK